MKSESPLERCFERGEFIVTAEIGPPKSADREQVAKKARILKEVCDGINTTDSQLAVCRMSSIAAAAIVTQEGGHAICQITLRDRNRIGLQSDLLGAWALGIRTIVCLTGDHPRHGNHPTAKPVYELDIFRFLRLVRRMREEGVFDNGEPIQTPPKFLIGGAANASIGSLDGSIDRLLQKREAGADFFQSQPVFDLDRFEEFCNALARRKERLWFLAGVLVARKARTLRHLQAHVPGVAVPENLLARMERVEAKDDPSGRGQQEEGIQIAVEQIRRIRQIGVASGVHIMSVGGEAVVPEVVKRAGLLPRPRFV